VAVLVVKVDLLLGAVPVFDCLFQGTTRLTQVQAVLIYMSQEFIVAGSTQGVGAGMAGEHLGALVPVRNNAVLVDEIDTVVQVVDEFLIK